MLRPIIMIGCGGSGQKAVRYVRDSVKRHLEHQGWEGDFPKAWQFLGIDTLTTQEDPSIPFLPNNDYVSVSLAFATYQGLNQAIETKFGLEVNPTAFHDLQGWRPNPSQVVVPLKDGAGQLRAVGRTAGVLALQDYVAKRISYAFSQCSAGGPELTEVSRYLGVNVPPGTPVPDPITIVVGSMAGGTGAGIMLDVVDLVRRTDIKGAFPVLVAFTPDIFGSIQTNAMTANSAAFMAEMLSSYWDDENTDSALIPATVAVNTRGPHSIFLVGRTNIDGLDLLDSKNVYRAVGEALAAVTTSSTVQTSFHNFITVNWPMAAPANAGGYGFHSSRMKGVASSFGSATISIGRDRFRDYIKKLLHRSIIEHLAEGFEPVAAAVLGDAAKSMAGPAKIAELSRRNIDRFMIDCGLSESDEGSKQISDRFVSNEIMKTRLGRVANNIKAPFAPAMQQNAGVWLQTINAQATQVKTAELSAVDAELGAELRIWGTELYQSVLKTTTEFSGTLSMPLVLSLLQSARAQVLQSSAKFKERAKEASGLAEKSREKARGHLSANQKGAIPMSAAPVQETIQDMSKAIVFDWSARVRERLALALESVATSMLSGIEASVNQSLARINMLTQPQDGKPAVLGSWPKNDGIVPTSFTPSPVEFFLEEFETWPEMVKQLLSKSIGDPAGLPIDPVEAARLLIIRGGFGGDGKGGAETTPLIWGDSHGTDPVWEPGQQVSININDDIEPLTERIDSWLMRPATEMLYVLTEGLSSYLMDKHHKTGTAIADHQQRLATFRQKLTLALMQSRPLVEIDLVMNATVHPQPLKYTLNIQGFPFGKGHPAREESEQVIQGFLNDARNVDWAFSSGDAESVLITNFLEYPVNPSVITSFTQPLHKAVGGYTPELLRSSFWQWRRARVLENFVPLPDELRVGAIRGFAVSRILGAMTALPVGQNKIATDKGVFNFPTNLLTETDKNNILPALLEAMVLVFADAPTRGKAAFNAYGALLDYGTGGGMAAGFEIDGVTAQILKTGEYGNVEIVDAARADSLGNDPQTRIKNAIAYLDANIKRYDAIESRPMHPHSWRNQVGAVDPVDTMTRELLPDLRKGHVMVREALERFESLLSNKETGDVA
jgi:hypothetical protein